MKAPHFAALLLGLAAAQGAGADTVTICYNYDCAVEENVVVTGKTLLPVRDLLRRAKNAEAERQAIAEAIGRFEAAVGERAPTRNDRGRNANDDGEGRMDCLDESHNTTAYLKLMEARGWLRHHRVLERVMRAPHLLDDHWAARIMEKKTGREFVVDSWFFDNGRPAVVYPLDAWKEGAEPDDNP